LTVDCRPKAAKYPSTLTFVASRRCTIGAMPTTPTSTRALTVAAWTNAVLHATGLALAALAMRPGTPSVALADRMAWLARAPLGWSVGWGVWMLCALALVAFVALASARLEAAPVVRPALALAAAGAAVDLLCDAAWITTVPSLARGGRAGEALFLAVERLAGAGGTIAANGLYSVSALLIALALRARDGSARVAAWLGAGVFACGLGLVAAGFTGDPRHVEMAAGATIGLYIAWTLAVARALRAR
jgi:hypothetical protein